eukprot:NODE_1285_length_1010_cov_191.241415_g340_i1.p1 GENE.NODE_1285_length_1010_cov_191.241415_g340_i1~~NODE_1285_length_1010_cov_191.241415_g340_i1.p1  ORF type:complete len:168 (+),score=19.72 NODE_1285_length_1010_cov_191.241415_g340_i1:300-803(+)
MPAHIDHKRIVSTCRCRIHKGALGAMGDALATVLAPPRPLTGDRSMMTASPFTTAVAPPSGTVDLALFFLEKRGGVEGKLSLLQLALPGCGSFFGLVVIRVRVGVCMWLCAAYCLETLEVNVTVAESVPVRVKDCVTVGDCVMVPDRVTDGESVLENVTVPVTVASS